MMKKILLSLFLASMATCFAVDLFVASDHRIVDIDWSEKEREAFFAAAGPGMMDRPTQALFTTILTFLLSGSPVVFHDASTRNTYDINQMNIRLSDTSVWGHVVTASFYNVEGQLGFSIAVPFDD